MNQLTIVLRRDVKSIWYIYISVERLIEAAVCLDCYTLVVPKECTTEEDHDWSDA
jgi:hypothetical protein